MPEGADHPQATAPPRPDEARSEWDPITGGIHCTWPDRPWGLLQVILFAWLLLQSTLLAFGLTCSAVKEWAAGGIPIRVSLAAAGFCVVGVGFAARFTRQIQGRGRPNELHASPDGFLYVIPTGLRRRVYIPREYIRDVRAEGFFSSLMFRQWRLCIELTTPCVPLHFPPKHYTLWTSNGRSDPEAWAKILRQAMNIRPAGPAPSRP